MPKVKNDEPPFSQDEAVQLAKERARQEYPGQFENPYVAQAKVDRGMWVIKLESHSPAESDCAFYFYAKIDAKKGVIVGTEHGGGA